MAFFTIDAHEFIYIYIYFNFPIKIVGCQWQLSMLCNKRDGWSNPAKSLYLNVTFIYIYKDITMFMEKIN